MKLSRLILLFLVIALSGLSSCALDDEIDIPGGDSDNRTMFLGSWSVSDNALKLNYEVTIDRDNSNSAMVVLRNFAGSGSSASGLVVGKSIVIESQRIGQNWQVNGSGSYKSDKRLDFNYTLQIGGSSEGRQAIFTR
ncbi:MAG: hypothetical protein M0Q90_16110 [Bacteroidales bacterium]|nr:hypothetical protein [Bacteroidales bacterium]